MIYSKEIDKEIPLDWEIKKLGELYVENPKSKIPVKHSLQVVKK